MKVIPEISQKSMKVTFYATFSSRITCKFEISLNTYTVNSEANSFLTQLSQSDNIGHFKATITEKLCQLAADGNIYMPYYCPNKWQQAVNALKQQIIPKKHDL